MASFKKFITNIFSTKKTENDFDIEKIAEYISTTLPPTECIKLTAQSSDTLTVFDTKLGGIPYLPKNATYPVGTGKYANRPLRLLAQLNFAQLPHINNFPTEGILQFFCSSDNDDAMYGLDLESETACQQNGFRVIYYPNIITDESLLTPENEMPQIEGEQVFPFDEQFALQAEKTIATASHTDFRAEATILKAIEATTGKKYNSLYELTDEQHDLVCNTFKSEGILINGYPHFTQDDPRYNEAYAKHTICLLQIDSDDDIMWGDMGVANFFIEPEKLKKLDFSNVLYNWDCY